MIGCPLIPVVAIVPRVFAVVLARTNGTVFPLRDLTLIVQEIPPVRGDDSAIEEKG